MQDDRYTISRPGDHVSRTADALVTFGGNHDMGRIGLEVAAASNAMGKPLLQRVLLAHSLLFLSRGTPAVYYGDEVGMMGDGGDKSARQSMFPTRVAAWRDEYRIGTTPIGAGSSLTRAAERHPIAQHISTLNRLRAEHPALATGQMIMRVASGSVIAWSKIHPDERKDYVVIVNSGNKPTTGSVPTSSPKTSYRSILGSRVKRTSSTTGVLQVTVAPRSTLVLEPSGAMPATATAPAIAVTASARDGLTGTRILSATLGRTGDAVSVTFVGRSCATCDWQALATDGAGPFRFYVDDAWFRDTKAWEVVGVVRTSDGRTRISGPVTIRR